MDYSKFLDDNFDVKIWVNSAFQSNKEPNVSKDQYATTLVMKLQMFIQEVNNVIEEASQQAIQNLPRVMREIDAVKQEAALLQEQMRMVKQDIEKVEQDTSHSMQMLLKLDAIKSRMTAAADALKEADNWTTLSADVEEVFQSQDVQAITTKLAGMQQSLQMLVDTPDYMERCQHLEKLKNRLEAMLSPHVVAAFNAQSVEAAQMYRRMFESIDRLPQLYKYYHKCNKNVLLQSWKDVLSSNADETLVEWLNALYDHLLSTWHNQIKWCSQVFSDPILVVCHLISDSLTVLDPSIASCMTTFLSLRGETLKSLIELKQISERFCKSIETAIIEPQMKDSVEHRAVVEKLLLTIYAPYRSYLAKYKTLEEVVLSMELNNIKLKSSTRMFILVREFLQLLGLLIGAADLLYLNCLYMRPLQMAFRHSGTQSQDHEEVFETVQLLSQSVNKLFTVANQANERCVKLSNGCSYVSLLEALKTYFCSYCREFRRVLVNIREKCKTSVRAGDLEDWSNFQHSLRIIQTCGDLIMHIDEFDSSIIMNIMKSVGHLTMSSSSGDTKSLLRAQASLFLEQRADIEALAAVVIKLHEGDTPMVLTECREEMCRLSEEVHKFAFDIVFAQLKGHLTNLSHMEIWTSKSAGGALTSDLPTFSLSPQEYITKIGQYMMTLPQHLEPFMLQDNPAVLVALKHGKLPYTDEAEIHEHPADLWLESIAHGTMHWYCEEILKIHELTAHGNKQLLTDIDYLCNVLDDLGLKESESLKNIDQLLKASPEDYHDIAEHKPQRFANSVGSMRKIYA